MSNNATILNSSPLQLLLSIHITIFYLHYVIMPHLHYCRLPRGWVYLEVYYLIVLLELVAASCALRSVFQLRHLVSYSYRMTQGTRYQPPYPVETFSNTVVHSQQQHQP